MIDGIRVKGKCFTKHTDLNFFNESTQRVSIVYGRNGSGKSTISRAFAIHDKEQTVDAVAEDPGLTADNPHPSSLESTLLPESPNHPPQKDRNQYVLVYNEDFIDTQVKLESDGLGTVVLFGQQAELHEKLEATKAQLTEAQVALSAAISSREDAEKQVQRANTQLEKTLKSGWAERSRMIHNSSIATKSWTQTREQLTHTSPANGDIQKLLSDLYKQIDKYRKVSTSDRITIPAASIISNSIQPTIATDILTNTLSAPTGYGLKSKVASSLKGFEEYVHKASQIFSDSNVKTCPMCQQDVEPSYRHELVEAIRATVNDEADRFQKQIENAKTDTLSINNSKLDERYSKQLIENLTNAVREYNHEAAKWNEACESKKTKLYTPIFWDKQYFEKASTRLRQCIVDIENERSEWNSSVDASAVEQRHLSELNDRVSRLEASQEFESHASALRQLRSSRNHEANLMSETQSLTTRLKELHAQIANLQIAADEINKNMREIFAEHGRLELELHVADSGSEDNVYYVNNRGRKIRPGDLSVGERNILALTYFFTIVRKMLDSLEDDDFLLIVLDDPISSVDVDNRLGIHGFLEQRTRKVLEQSDKVRLIFFTHDLTVAREYSKSAQAAMPHKSQNQTKKWSRVCYQLSSAADKSETGALERRNLEKLNEYKSLLALAYEYASSKPEEVETGVYSLTIGNITRRVLEAFSTFIYDGNILDPVLAEAYSESTGGRVLAIDLTAGHRGFLHDSSHAEDGITSLRDFGGFAGLSTAEQIHHVRRIIAMMYTLQQTHMRRHLPLKAEETVRDWQKELMIDRDSPDRWNQ